MTHQCIIHKVFGLKYQHQVCLSYNMAAFITDNNKQYVSLRFAISSSHKKSQRVHWLFVWLSFHIVTGDHDSYSAVIM